MSGPNAPLGPRVVEFTLMVIGPSIGVILSDIAPGWGARCGLAVRDHRLPRRPAHGAKGGDRSGRAAHAGGRLGLCDLRRVRHGHGEQLFVVWSAIRNGPTSPKRLTWVQAGPTPLIAPNIERGRARDAILPAVRALFATLTPAALVERLETLGLLSAPITRPDELFDDPHLWRPAAS